MTIRVAIFDNNENVRNDIISMLSVDPVFEIAGSFRDTLNCVQKVIFCMPDIVLLNIDMPCAKGVKIVSLLNKETPHVQILVQSSSEEDDHIYNIMCAGASGFILKNHINVYLIKALKDLRNGGAPMSPSIARKVLNRLRRDHQTNRFASNIFNLTSGELHVLRAIKDGHNYKTISEMLYITTYTVRRRMKKIQEKLNVDSRAEAIAKAIQQRIV